MIKAAIVSGPSSSITCSTRRTYVAATSVGIDIERWAVRVGRMEMDEPSCERLVRSPVSAPAARGKCLAGHSVICAVVREHLVLAWIPGLPVELARHLDRSLDGLRASAAPLEGGVLRWQEREERARELDASVTRRHRRCGKREPGKLSRHGVDDASVAVPQAHAERSRQPVDVPPTVHVPHADPVSLGQDQRVLAERLHLGEIDHHPADVVSQRWRDGAHVGGARSDCRS